MPKKLSDDYVRDFIKKNDCEWISGEYKSNTSKLYIKFECGCFGYVTFMNFNKGTRCREHGREKASIKRRKPLFEMIEYLESYGFNFIKHVSGYGRESILEYSCELNHITQRCFNDFTYHPTCKICESNKVRSTYKLSPEEVHNRIESKGCSLRRIHFYNNRKDSLLDVVFSCGHSETISFVNFDSRNTNLCVDCEMESRSGETAYGWKGGITPLTNYIRKNIKDWNIYCSKYYDYKCIITNLPMDHIHHLQSFNLILFETMKELGFTPKNSIKDYSEKELSLILNKFIDVQSRYPIGVPLISSVHHLFHKIYGRGNNTPEQFYEFVDRIESGEIIINK